MIPLPVQTVVRTGVFVLPDNPIITPSDPLLLNAATLLADSLRGSIGESGTVDLKLVADLPKEGYRLSVDQEKITIEGDPAGVFYGTQTLLQILASGPIPCQTIEDAPRFVWRGFMLDCSRHFQSVERVKWILDQMAVLKLNTLHWHLADDQGWRLEIKRYPKLTEITQLRSADEPDGRGYYTQDQIREIVSYAMDRHINIVPEIEIPAHTTAAMAAYPELTCTGEPAPVTGFGINTFVHSTGQRIYCAASEKVLEFIDGVMTEVVDLFPSPVIHVGGDERPEGIWTRCPRCSALMEQEGLPSEAALQRWLMGKVAKIVNAKGRRTMAWTPTVEFGVPTGEVVQDWFYRVTHDAIKLGADVVNSWDRWTYFDYPNFPGRQKPDWMPDLALEKVYEYEAIPEEVAPEEWHKVLGGECSLWTEFLEDEDFCGAIFPRMLAFAETVWSPKASRCLPDFLERLRDLEPFMVSRGVHYAKPERGVKLRRPGRVESTIRAEGPYLAECAADGKFVRTFWSQEPPKAGDHLTVWFDEAVVVNAVRLYTGSDICPKDVLESGLLEISTNGVEFESVAEVKGEFTSTTFEPKSIQAIRVSVTADQTNRLAIREIVWDEQ